MSELTRRILRRGRTHSFLRRELLLRASRAASCGDRTPGQGSGALGRPAPAGRGRWGRGPAARRSSRAPASSGTSSQPVRASEAVHRVAFVRDQDSWATYGLMLGDVAHAMSLSVESGSPGRARRRRHRQPPRPAPPRRDLARPAHDSSPLSPARCSRPAGRHQGSDAALRVLRPILQAVPARLIGIGVLPEHVRVPAHPPRELRSGCHGPGITVEGGAGPEVADHGDAETPGDREDGAAADGGAQQ
jgi:hypothetical protein